jgi:hypothetical protein
MRCLAFLLLAQALVQALPAQQIPPADTQAGDFFFKMPAGWSASQQGNVFFLNAPPTTPGAQTMISLAAYPLKGSLRKTLDLAWNEYQKSYRVLQAGQVVTVQIPAGNRAVSLSARVADQQGTQIVVLLLLAQNGGRAEGVWFMTNDLAPQTYQAHLAELTNFLATLHFADLQGPQPALPGSPTSPGNPGQFGGPQPGSVEPGGGGSATNSLVPGTLSGVYRLVDGAHGAGTQSPPYLVFFASGRMRRSLPNSLLDDYNDAYQMGLDKRMGPNFSNAWGTYRMVGDQGQIVFINGGETWDITRYPDRLQVRGATYVLLDPGNGVRLHGTYKPVDDASKSITFRPDGSMVEEGVISDCTSSTSYGYSGGNLTTRENGRLCFDKPRTGEYRIANYAIELSFPDTTRPRLSFWLEAGAITRDAPVIYIGKVKYQRVQ